MQLAVFLMSSNTRLRFTCARTLDNVRRVMKRNRRKYLNVNTKSTRARSRKYNTETISTTRRLPCHHMRGFIRYVNRCKIMLPYCRRSPTRIYTRVRVWFLRLPYADRNEQPRPDVDPVKIHLSVRE